MLDSDDPLRFAGEMRAASVVVCEIFNHDELMEQLSTEHFVAATNLLLHRGADFLVGKGGYLDECAGETLRVIFGAPLSDESHSVRACEAALELAAELDAVNRECMEKWNQALDFRGDGVRGVWVQPPRDIQRGGRAGRLCAAAQRGQYNLRVADHDGIAHSGAGVPRGRGKADGTGAHARRAEPRGGV
jgi:hypothetical protein